MRRAAAGAAKCEWRDGRAWQRRGRDTPSRTTDGRTPSKAKKTPERDSIVDNIIDLRRRVEAHEMEEASRHTMHLVTAARSAGRPVFELAAGAS